MKRLHSFLSRSFKINSRPRIQCNQIHLRPQAAQQLDHLAACSRESLTSPSSTYSNVIRSRLRSGNSRAAASNLSRFHFLFKRHDALAQFIIRCVQRNRQLGPDRLPPEIMNTRHNPRRRNRHPRFADADLLHQQAHRFDEVVVVQKRLAHSHENQIDASLLRRNSLIVQHRAKPARRSPRRSGCASPRAARSGRTGNPPRNPPGSKRKSSPDPKPRAGLLTAESPASVPSPASPPSPSGIQTVSTRLAVREADQVAHRPVLRDEFLLDHAASRPTPLRSVQNPAKFLRKRGNLRQRRNALPVDGLDNLLRAVGRLPGSPRSARCTPARSIPSNEFSKLTCHGLSNADDRLAAPSRQETESRPTH